MSVDLRLVEDICCNCTRQNFYVLEDIPQKKLQNAVQFFPLTNTKKVYMLYDDTMFGSCKNGIAVCDNGVFFKNDALSEIKYKYFTWEQFGSLNIYIKGNDICFGDNYKAGAASGLKVGREKMLELFLKLQKAVFYKQESAVEVSPKWMMAIDGKQFGPFETDEIEGKIINNTVNPNRTLLWKQGMSQWELLANLSEFKETLDKLIPMDIPPVPPIISTEQTRSSVKNDTLNINSCTIEELLVLECFDLPRARLLEDLRSKGKKFFNAEDVGSMLDLKPHEVEELKSKVEFDLPVAARGIRRVEF